MRALYWLMLAIPLTGGCGGDDKAADSDEDNVADDGADDDAGPCGITSQVSCQAACSNIVAVCADNPEWMEDGLDEDACTQECTDEPWGACFVQCSTEAQTCSAVFTCDEGPEGSDTGD